MELQAALEERDRARHDASDTSLAQDEVVIKAREDRDMAVQRRTKAEVELAKTRVELMQANSQLLEVIQQKVEMSQQLEQWQVIAAAAKNRLILENYSCVISDGHAGVARRATTK